MIGPQEFWCFVIYAFFSNGATLLPALGQVAAVHWPVHTTCAAGAAGLI